MKKEIITTFLMCGLFVNLHSQNINKTNYEQAKSYSNGKIKTCKLVMAVKIDDFTCKNWVYFFESGKLKQFEAAMPVKVKSNELPIGSTIILNTEGWIESAFLFENIVYDNIKCRGLLKTSIEFYKNGNLKICFLSEDQKIKGVPCKADLEHPVYFYENGNIKKCTLSGEHNIGSKLYRKNQTLKLDEKGNVILIEK